MAAARGRPGSMTPCSGAGADDFLGTDRLFKRSLEQHNRYQDVGAAGLSGDWAAEPIALFGRNSLSGTFDTFKEAVLRRGEFKDEVKQQPGSETVVQVVANDKFAIGYSGIGFLTEGVRAVPLAAPQNRKCYDPSAESAYSGDYPLARYLRLYLNKKPDQPVDPLIADFIRFVLSKDGQLLAIKSGFYPVPNATRLLKSLGISGDAS
ncbi:MAG TPA: substrate-binding domain-containing protein [Roseiarcus sp.]|nr:substrate-binding domain-containing protein [Roseiarcus sp.]